MLGLQKRRMDFSGLAADQTWRPTEQRISATCAFSASFPITAKLSSGSTLKLTFSNLDFQCKCKGPFGGAYQQTPVNLGTETCKSTDATAKGTLSVCFAGCSPGGAITSAAITEFKISDSTTVTCGRGVLDAPEVVQRHAIAQTSRRRLITQVRFQRGVLGRGPVLADPAVRGRHLRRGERAD